MARHSLPQLRRAMSLSLIAAMLLDAVFGEPEPVWRRAPHPAALMGRTIAGLERRLNRGPSRRAKGVAALLLHLIFWCLVAGLIMALPFGPLPEIIAAAILIAQRSLVDHVSDVADGLDGGLDEGRAAVAKIVGRDVAALDGPGVTRAAIESAAENLSDGVVAPIFWGLIAGLPGLVVYKALNTADSMIGYRNERYGEFGWAAARADDLANLIPARLSALLIAVVHGSLAPWRAALRDAGLHRSPNAGWPEAATAAAIGVALSGPRSYEGRRTDDPFVWPEGDRNPGAADIRRAVGVLWKVWFALLGVVLVAAAVF